MIKRTGISFMLLATFSLMLTPTFLAFPVIANATTYYVATNGSNTSPYDTWAKAAASIQTAVNAASNDDIIIVGSSDGYGAGTYTENVDVNKQLTIQSENGNSTTEIIASNTNDHVFYVTADSVTIEGFSIYGATGVDRAGICLTSVTNCTIENNRCGWDFTHTNYYGIYLSGSSNCTINNNTASYNNGVGIYMNTSSEDTLTANIASNNSGDGISLYSSSSNTLNSNTANNNSFDGIRLVPSSNSNTLNNNTATGNGNNGFLIVESSDNNLTGNTANSNTASHGIYLVSSSNNNTLNSNTADSNMSNGIRLENCSGNNLDGNSVTHNEFGVFLTSSSNNTITSNIMNENDGRVDGDGIMLADSDNNVISNNTMNNDPGDGIEFANSSNNIVMDNTLDNSGLIDPGASIRINYYSSYNSIINNTVINGSGGIVLEEESNYNIVSNNTITGHSGRGFEFWENASYNTLTGNNISNNGTYGIWLPSGNYNTIYLNDISNNITSNIYSESSTTTWHSPTTIYYAYNDSTFHKGYLGNYYSDGTHSGNFGIGGTYTIANDNDDEYQLISTINNYSLQAWWLHSDDKMYRSDFSKAGGSVTISNGGTNIWKADQVALTDIIFSGSDTWTGQLVFTAAPTTGHILTIEIGSSTDGSDFTAGGPNATLTGNGSATKFNFETDASAFTVSAGKYLAIRITSNHAEYSIRTGGVWSYASSPDNSADYPLLVELASFTARQKNNTVILEWQTASEQDNLGFIIERKNGGEKFTEIASYLTDEELKGAGNTSALSYYEFTDENIVSKTTYQYRISDVDYSGKITNLKTEQITITGNSTDLSNNYVLKSAYPIPFNPTFTIPLTLKTDAYVNIKLINTLGQKVMQIKNNQMTAGNHNLQVNCKNLTSGIYFVKVRIDKANEIQKVVLLK
ncbi:MAG: NosD domain-containing protein [Candidatus Krumholzibacteriota bacterium]|nr:NosD domain-containing protein [Candidatus Krumholzibacteriota bacterium]